MGQTRLPESQRRSGGNGNIDDAATDERSAIDDCDDCAAAVIEIDYAHLGSDRQTAVGRKQSAVARIWIK